MLTTTEALEIIAAEYGEPPTLELAHHVRNVVATVAHDGTESARAYQRILDATTAELDTIDI